MPDVHDFVLPSDLPLSFDQKATSQQNSTTSTKTMSDSTTLFKKQCFPTTKSLREAVGVFFARHQRSFVASKNNGGKQKVYFCSRKEGGCPAEVRAILRLLFRAQLRLLFYSESSVGTSFLDLFFEFFRRPPPRRFSSLFIALSVFFDVFRSCWTFFDSDLSFGKKKFLLISILSSFFPYFSSFFSSVSSFLSAIS